MSRASVHGYNPALWFRRRSPGETNQNKKLPYPAGMQSNTFRFQCVDLREILLTFLQTRSIKPIWS